MYPNSDLNNTIDIYIGPCKSYREKIAFDVKEQEHFEERKKNTFSEYFIQPTLG